MTTELFILKAKEAHGTKYDYSKSNYVNAKTDVCIICPKHGEFLLKPHNHLSESGCPKCKISKRESLIHEVLKELEITYKFEIPIKNPYNDRNFKIDFEFCLNNKKYIIEYNGGQHYIPVKHFGGELSLEKLLKRDKDLVRFCLENDIKLITIPYCVKDKELIKEIILLNINDDSSLAIIPLEYFYQLITKK